MRRRSAERSPGNLHGVMKGKRQVVKKFVASGIAAFLGRSICVVTPSLLISAMVNE